MYPEQTCILITERRLRVKEIRAENDLEGAD